MSLVTFSESGYSCLSMASLRIGVIIVAKIGVRSLTIVGLIL